MPRGGSHCAEVRGVSMRVIQVLDALDFGDGVSNDVIHLQELLTEIGIENRIYSKWWNEKVAGYTADIEQYRPRQADWVLYHFSGKSYILDQVIGYGCRRIVRYHNVTPPEFFLPDNPSAYAACKEGLQQIRENIQEFDGFWADSAFNARDLICYGAAPQTVDVLPVIFDFQRLKEMHSNEALLQQLKRQGPYILFVGRVAPNKKQEDILEAFENYYRYYNRRARLYLVGNMEQSSSYTQSLFRRLEHMAAKEQVIFTGKVSEEDLYTYYRGASAFLCMSEHEGFCIPIMEAQFFGVPVIAYDSCAVPDTMGKSGLLLYQKDPAVAAYLLDAVMTDGELRNSVLECQRKNIESYRRSAMKERLVDLLKKIGG